MAREHVDIHKNLKLAIFLTSLVLVIEIIGGVLSNSLALLSDAAHVFMDVFALLMTFGALVIAARPPTHGQTFGYHRFEILAALLNGFTLIGVSLLIFYEAYLRILSPPEVRGTQMLVFALIGLSVNGWVAFKLRGHRDLSIRSAYMHVLGDMLSSIAVIVGALLIILFSVYKIDPILSFLIGGVLLYGAFGIVRGSLRILLEFSPEHIDTGDVIHAINKIDGIEGVHDIHLWSICSHVHAMSAHVLVKRMDICDTEELARVINETLRRDFLISHTTLQFETTECGRKEVQEIGHS